MRAAVQFADDLPVLIKGDWAAILAQAEQDWQHSWPAALSDAQLMTAVRRYRNRSHLAIALAELFGQTRIDTSWGR